MAKTNAADMARLVEFMKTGRRADDTTLEDVMGLAGVMAESLQGYFRSLDDAIHDDLGEMAREIAAMKQEISALDLGDMRHERIPAAGRELDAIVEATEEATNTIMTAAEEIMCADPSDSEAYQALVNDKIVEIFQACSFQDITGQRISKVVKTLGVLDQRITQLVDRMKLIRLEPGTAAETDEERRARELILNGPQMKGEGVSQDDIDALLR